MKYNVVLSDKNIIERKIRFQNGSKALEEFLEMFVTTIFLTVLLEYLLRLSQEWQINIAVKS